MAFDWKMFAGSFLEQITEGIEENTEEAKRYKEQQEQAAERNAALVNQRNLRAKEAAQLGKRAMQLGASESQVRTAMSSGMQGVREFYDKLEKVANQKGMKRLGVDDIEAIVTMPNIPDVNPRFKDMSLEDFAQQTYGARGLAAKPPEDDVSFVGKMFGVGAKDRAKAQLAETEFADGMSIADINAAARQAEYQSLIPGATMTFLDVPYFSSEKALDFSSNLIEAMDDAEEAGEAGIKAAIRAADEAGEDIVEARINATLEARTQAAENFIQAYANTYQHGGFFDNVIAAKSIIAATDKQFLRDLFDEYLIEPSDRIKELLEEDPEDPKEKDPEKETPPTEAEKETLRRKEEIEANVYHQIEDEEGDTKVVNSVPPRPDGSMSTLFFGQGMGGEDIEAILKGEMPVPKYLRPSQWDELFGDTHNPDGSPKE